MPVTLEISPDHADAGQVRLFVPSGGSAVRRPVVAAAGGIVATAGLSLSIIGGAPAASAASTHGHEIQPTGAWFSAAFPRQPRALPSPPGLLVEFPGSTSVKLYAASSASVHDLVARHSPVPKTPTYLVAVVTYAETQDAANYFAAAAAIPHVKPITVDGYNAWIYNGHEKGPLNKPSEVRQPHAHESMLVTDADGTLFLAIGITKKAAPARAFVTSLEPAFAKPIAGPPPATNLIVPKKGTSAAHRAGEDTGIALIVLLVAALVYKYGVADRRRRPSPTRGAAAGFPPPASSPSGETQPPVGAAAAPMNANFNWLYEQPGTSPVNVLPGVAPSTAAPPVTQPPAPPVQPPIQSPSIPPWQPPAQ